LPVNDSHPYTLIHLQVHPVVHGGVAGEALALEGSGWEGDLDRMRDDAPPTSA